MTAAKRDRWATVPCPRCAAAVGERCTGEGQELRRAHWERFKAARADPEVRDRGKWASAPQDARATRKRGFTLPPDLHDALDVLAEDGANQSAIAAEALMSDARVIRAMADPRAAAKRAARKKDTPEQTSA